MNNLINDLFNIIDITLIDLNEDKVYLYDKYTENPSSISYEDYFERCKKSLHPDYANTYFNEISANNLPIDGYKTINFLKLSNLLIYDNYTALVKLLPGNKVFIVSFKSEEKPKKEEKNDISSDITDLILNIENTLESISRDNNEVNNLYNYFSSLLYDVVKKNPEINKYYEGKLISKMNNFTEYLLIVDDDDLTRSIFKKAFSSYNIIEAKNGEEAVEIINNNLKTNEKNIVGMFLDLKMPVMDGFGVLDFLNEKRLLNKMPVVIVSADDSKDTKEKVYAYEIADMIEKPFNFEIINKRLNNMVRMYSKNNYLSDIIKSQNKDLSSILESYVNSYIIDNSAVYKKASEVLSLMLTDNKDIIINASKYYDVGLKLVPVSYFNGFNNLNEDEKKVIYSYPNKSVMVLNNTNFLDEKTKEYAKNICLMHNERYDGKGFPKSLKGEEVPLYIYLVNIAYEYARGIIKNVSKEDMIKLIVSKNGTKYSPESIEIFNKISGDIK